MRDPRAVMSSRCSKTVDWCGPNSVDDLGSVEKLCQAMKEDLVLLNAYSHLEQGSLNYIDIF